MSRFGSEPIPGMPEPSPEAPPPPPVVVENAPVAHSDAQPTRRIGGLRVLNGPWTGDLIDLPAEAGEAVLGRNDPPAIVVDIDLADAELGKPPMISRRHAMVRRGPSGEITVEDLGSTNGTWVGARRLRAGERSAALEVGTTLRLANIEMVAAEGDML